MLENLGELPQVRAERITMLSSNRVKINSAGSISMPIAPVAPVFTLLGAS